MQNACTYHQPCPVCGRSLQVNVTLLGKTVYCQHCGGGFLASDPCGGPRTDGTPDQRAADLLERANALLATVGHAHRDEGHGDDGHGDDGHRDEDHGG